MLSSLPMILDALAPVAFVILLGLLAGRLGLIKPEDSSVLAALALDFCLPALLFAATVKMTLPELENWPFFVGIAIGLLAIYLIALALSLAVFRKPIAASSLQALNSAFPNMAFMGVPVLTAVIGASAVLSIVIGNLISSFVLLPLTLTLLEAGSPGQEKKPGASVVWSSLLGAVKQPLVWAPLVGIVMAAAQIPLPDLGQKSFNLIGEATSGVALFTLGLVLSGQKLRIGPPAAADIAFKILGPAACNVGLGRSARRDRRVSPRDDPVGRPSDRVDDGDVRGGIQGLHGRIGRHDPGQHTHLRRHVGRMHRIDQRTEMNGLRKTCPTMTPLKLNGC